jgi:hypothetical protein
VIHKGKPDQLKLFMSGGEWKRAVSDSVDRQFATGPKTMRSVWREKLAESKEPADDNSHGSGIHDALSTHGYQHSTTDPPTIFVGSNNESVQGEGHHRIAAAADIERTTGRKIWIPTNYREHPYL